MRRSRKLPFQLALLIVIAIVFVGSLGAQSTGTISGVVRDASGGVVPGASVEAVNQGTGASRVAVSNDGGQYVLPLLPIGTYSVTASLSGFQTTQIPNVSLELGQSRDLDVTMQVASVETGVTVTAGVANVDLSRSDATIGQVVHGEQVENLPLNGRNFVQLALLGPGTTTGRQGSFLAEGPSSEVSYRGTMSVSAQGMRENANDWLYDGIDNNELSAGGIAILPSIETIAEFKVLTYNFSAQYGSRGGTTILVSTKSGTNNFHGSLFNFHRNDVLDARNFFDGPDKGKLIRNQYGFSVGGPIVRDRTFFFGGFEGTNLREGLTVQSTVPTALMRQGIFTESFPDAGVRTVYDPSTTRTDPGTGQLVRDPFPNNTIPTNQISPIGSAIFDLMPLPTRSDRLGNNYLSNPVKTLDNYSFYGRVDHEIGENDKLFVRISTEDGDSFLPSGVPGFAARGSFASNQTFKTDARNIATAYTHLFSPTTINQFTAGYNRVFNFITSFGFGTNQSQALGIPGANLGSSETSSLTRMSFQNFIGVGDRGFSPFQGGTNVYQFGDTVTMVRGNHTLNVGGVTRLQQLNQFGDSALAGALGFTTSFTAGFSNGSLDSSTGSSIASGLLGLPANGGRTDLLQGSVSGRRWKEYRGFIDDTWKVSPDLTFTLGFGYSVSTPQSEAADRFSNFDFYTGQYFTGGTIGVNTDYSNIQPRLGFSWSPGGSRNMVLRGGYGLFYDYAAQGGAQGPQSNPPFINQYSFSSDSITPVRTLATGFPDNSQPVTPQNFTGAWTTVDPNYKNGRIQQWNVNIERKLPGQMVFMASYAGTHGDRLFNKGLNLNTAPPGFPLFNPASRRPYPNLEAVNATLSRSFLDYHSMQLRLERRATEGGFLLLSYTWSKGLTNGQSGLGGDPGTLYFPNLTGDADKAANNTDLRHNLRLSYLYELPFGSSLTGVSKALLHGWNINSILLAHSGYPLAMSVFNLSGTSGFSNRPNRICDGGLNNPTIDRWFDVGCFPAPPAGQYGNAARTTLFGPGRWNLDLSLSKQFSVSDTSHLEFRTEFFNALNHSQFAVPGTGVDGFSAGRISSTVQTSRQIQFALKYVF